MTGSPEIDLAGEMGFAATDYVLIALVILVALAFLTRRMWRRKNVPGACDSCPGCGRGASCQLPGVLPPATEPSRLPRPTRPDAHYGNAACDTDRERKGSG
jgi:hypothetical protein